MMLRHDMIPAGTITMPGYVEWDGSLKAYMQICRALINHAGKSRKSSRVDYNSDSGFLRFECQVKEHWWTRSQTRIWTLRYGDLFYLPCCLVYPPAPPRR